MTIVQSNSGTWTGTSFTPTLLAASAASNGVLIIVAGNTTVTTPGSWSLRTSQVNQMGHYLYTRDGVSLTSVAMTSGAGQGTWVIVEVQGGTYDTSSSANAATGTNTYNTPTLTPTAGAREVIASLASLSNTGARTISGWTNSFTEFADTCQATADNPMQGAANLAVTADGVTGYSTTGTYSQPSTGRSAIIVSYGTGSGAAAAPPDLLMQLRRAF